MGARPLTEGDRIAEALQEALWFLESPAAHPRHWPVSRANLGKLLTEALAERKKELGERS